MQNNSQTLKVRYSIESYEKLLITVEELRKSNEDILKRLQEDRLNDDKSRLKVE